MTLLSKPTPKPELPRVHYEPASSAALPADVLFCAGFGAAAAEGARQVRVPLEPLAGAGVREVWRAQGTVHTGEFAGLRFSHDDAFLAGVIEVREHDHGDIEQATAFAYRTIATFQSTSAFPHLLRTWNYFDAINAGDGEAERYRGFCSGRVTGLARLRQTRHPAATVIGRRDGRKVLQVYWLAGREPGVALENPRQVSAYRYPRQYGATAPTFSRAMLVPPGLLMVSGTASIVGHASQHAGNVRAQVGEILANLDSLLCVAHARERAIPARLGPHTLIKAYLRNADDLPEVEEALRERLPAGPPALVLHGDVCRSELLVEFDCTQVVA